MSFISKIIPSKKVILIDVGTYKVKTALCEYKNNEMNILSYAEKKQEASDIIGSEIANIEAMSNTIAHCLDKLLQESNTNPHDIVINIPTSTIISCGKNLHYTRSISDENITIEELDYIIAKAEKEALEEAKTQIQNKTGYSEVDMKLITSSITEINIDGFKVSNPLGFTGKNIHLSLLNIFIPASRYHIINTIASYLEKNILSIIPLEFSLPKVLSSGDYAHDDVVFIDIGNTKTSLIIQKAGVIIGFDKVNLGIHDLIKTIKERSGETTIEVIKNIQDESKYTKEKQEFLSVWEEGLIITLKEILQGNLVPYKLLISGGGDNPFVRDYISKISLSKYGLHSLKPFCFINIDFEKDIKINGDKKIFDKTNIGLLSMIIASKEVIQYKNNPILSIIKNFLEKNEW